MTISILKIVAVITILAMMIVILLSVNHFLRGDFDSSQDEIDLMRKEVEETDDVISDKSVFKEMVNVRSNHHLIHHNQHQA